MFKVLKKEGKARRSEFTTVHGTVQTPAFMNVATSAAIKGGIRADYFWGHGEQAFENAGRMNQAGSYYILLPKE